jgi:hypothetical protein
LLYRRKFFTISRCRSALSRLGGRGRQHSWKKRSWGVLQAGGQARGEGEKAGRRQGQEGNQSLRECRELSLAAAVAHSSAVLRQVGNLCPPPPQGLCYSSPLPLNRPPMPHAHLYSGWPLKLQIWKPFSMAAAALTIVAT